MNPISFDGATQSARLSRPLRDEQSHTLSESALLRSESTIILPTPLGVIAIDYSTFVRAVHAGKLFAEPAARNTQPSIATHRYVDASAIADRFNMDSSWFLTRARENRIPHIRIGKYVRFDPVEIRDFFHREVDRHANL